MDALHPRLLVTDFPAAFGFYDVVLTELFDATRTRGDAEGPYASWDVGGQGALTLLARGALAAVTGAPAAPPGPGPAPDTAMLVSHVPDVAAAYALALAHGGTPVAPPAPRPEWGPTMHTAHLRDPEGHLVEFQSY